MSKRGEFLAGERPDDVLMYFAEDALDGIDALEEMGEMLEDGVVLVVDGERGRSAFKSATGMDAMGFAQRAMKTYGEVDRDCTGGDCPAREEEPGDHSARIVFAFAEAQNEDVDGIYAEGDVIHAYVSCTCGQPYSDKWVVDEA